MPKQRPSLVKDLAYQFPDGPMDIINPKNQKTPLILLALFIFVWTQRIHLRDFFDGVFQGYAAACADHAAVQQIQKDAK